MLSVEYNEEKKSACSDDDHDDIPLKMKALVFQGVGKKPKLCEVSRPRLVEPTDVIIRVHKTTICGTDLHILGGNVPTCQPGRILGHEGIGHVVCKGDQVHKWEVGDRILTSCITACGHCDHCRHDGLHAFCERGGWQLGNTINGMQAEYARIPHADYTAHALPASVPLQPNDKEDPFVMTSDILPTGFEIGLRSGRIPQSTSIAFVGTGPVGLAALLSAVAMDKARNEDALKFSQGDDNGSTMPIPKRRIFAIDRNQSRLKTAANMGATDLIDNSDSSAVSQILALTNGKGVDFVVECIGLPVGWEIAQDIVSMGGEISILGVHGKPAMFKLEKLWQHNVSIHTGMVHCNTIEYFMRQIELGHLDANQLISHQFSLSQVEDAYEHFAKAEATSSLKVIITNDFK